MLSIGKLGTGAEEYYLGAVALGADEYYTGAGEIPGRWVGSAARSLALNGAVEPQQLRALLTGVHPLTGATIGSTPRRVPGFDLTFSAPKSASLLFAFGSPEVVQHVVAGHEASVAAALGYLEREACFVRRGKAGAFKLAADGFIGAAFRHRTSRSGDPQLHTHVLVANIAAGPDGDWTALDARYLYRHARTAGFLYQAQLRAELTARLGVTWRAVMRGMSEIEALPSRVLRAFSQRRAAIEHALERQEASGRRAAQMATLTTRVSKPPAVDDPALRNQWREQADRVGLDLRVVSRATGVGRTVPPLRIGNRSLGRRLTEERSTFDRPAVLRSVAEQARRGASVAHVEGEAERFLASREVVRAGPGRWTTPEMISLERAAVTSAVGRLDRHVSVVDTEALEDALDGCPALSPEQRSMVVQLTTSGHGVEVVIGVPGAGKTEALAVAAQAWRVDGYAIVGTALAARAADELQTRAHIPSRTLHSLLGGLDSGAAYLAPETVVVVDEAGMVGTRQLARLLTHASSARAKVVLVGDDRQLPEIAAGGVFSGLARRLPAVQLVESHRHRDPVERAALAELRAGRPSVAVERLLSHGRVTLTATRAEARSSMVRDWLAARGAGEKRVMLAVKRGDVLELNREARAALVERGEVQANGAEARGQMFGTGDRVMTLSNWHRHGIVNGACGTVRAIRDGGLDVRFDSGKEITLPSTYLRAGHVAHGYAMTIHKAQGMTADRSFVLADQSLFREAGYTALSRGRFENHLFVVGQDVERSELSHGPPEAGREPMNEVIGALGESHSKHMAIDTGALEVAPVAPSLPPEGPMLEL